MTNIIQKITAKELADKLNGREYHLEMTPKEIHTATENGLIVIYGESDDLIHFKGVVSQEMDCYETTKLYLYKDGLEWNVGDEHDIKSLEEIIQEKTGFNFTIKTYLIKPMWAAVENEKVFWEYHTELPHETFHITEEGQLYCVGIIIDLKEIEYGN